MRKRLDEILIVRGLVPTKEAAFIVITEGRVFVSGQKAISGAQLVDKDAIVDVHVVPRYVGRGAFKLEAALDAFGADPSGKICADIGSSTGGFVHVLLERGAKKVYAIDTARGKLSTKLRYDPRVKVMEGIDVRDVEIGPRGFYDNRREHCDLPELVNLVTIDVSLVGLRDIVPHAGRFLSEGGDAVALFKPQYETRDPSALRHGVVQDAQFRERLFIDFLRWVEEHGWQVKGKMVSPITGAKGNVEYLVHLALLAQSG